MKIIVASLLMGTCALVAQFPTPIALNPKRISSADVRQEGATAHYIGSVSENLDSLIVYTEKMDYRAREWGFVVRGDSRLVLKREATDYTRLAITDPKRFRANEIRQNGEVTTLHGSVQIDLPGWSISAADAVFDKAAATVALHGDARFEALKPPIEGVPHTLGPVFLMEGQAGN